MRRVGAGECGQAVGVAGGYRRVAAGRVHLRAHAEMPVVSTRCAGFVLEPSEGLSHHSPGAMFLEIISANIQNYLRVHSSLRTLLKARWAGLLLHANMDTRM